MFAWFKSVGDPAFIPHGYCLSWNAQLVGLHVVSDTLIALSYFSIPAALLYFALHRRERAFNGILLLFAAFIVACGATHAFAVYTLWQPAYWLDGTVKAATAGISLVSAGLLWPLIPKALAVPSPAALQQEIMVRQHTEEALRGSNAALETINRELESFAYSVSHDLRQPVRAVNGFARILVEDHSASLDAQAQDCLLRIEAAGQRMGQMIEALLELSRISRGTLNLQRVNLSAVAREVVDELGTAQSTHRPQAQIEPGLEAVADLRLLRLMLQNLLGNAWKFTGGVAAPRIEIGRQAVNGAQAFFVRDNGAGFDMAYADKLFGAFQRLHQAEDFPGTGIGLATAQRIVRRHGGRIWAEGKVGEGATFYFTL